jgi:hypothetical protein
MSIPPISAPGLKLASSRGSFRELAAARYRKDYRVTNVRNDARPELCGAAAIEKFKNLPVVLADRANTVF